MSKNFWCGWCTRKKTFFRDFAVQPRSLRSLISLSMKARWSEGQLLISRSRASLARMKHLKSISGAPQGGTKLGCLYLGEIFPDPQSKIKSSHSGSQLSGLGSNGMSYVNLTMSAKHARHKIRDTKMMSSTYLWRQKICSLLMDNRWRFNFRRDENAWNSLSSCGHR